MKTFYTISNNISFFYCFLAIGRRPPDVFAPLPLSLNWITPGPDSRERGWGVSRGEESLRCPIWDSETPGRMGTQHPASLYTPHSVHCLCCPNVSATQKELSSSGSSLNSCLLLDRDVKIHFTIHNAGITSFSMFVQVLDTAHYWNPTTQFINLG